MAKNDKTDAALNSDDVANMFAQGLMDSKDTLRNYRYEGKGTRKLFGLIELDGLIATLAEGLWASVAQNFNKAIGPKTYNTVNQQLTRHLQPNQHVGKYFNDSTINRISAGTALAVTTAMTTAPVLGNIIQKMTEQQRKKAELVRKVAPVLDDLMGNHSIGAFDRVGRKNEVLMVQRRRMRKEHDTTNFYDLIYAAALAIPNLFDEGLNFESLKTGKHRQTIRQERWDAEQQRIELEKQKALDPNAAQQPSGPPAEEGNLFDFKKLGGAFTAANLSVTQIVEQVRKKKLEFLEKNRPAFTALEMILELESQAQYKTDGSFTLPDKRQALPLDRYVEAVIMQHQRDMAHIDSEHTEIRKALEEDVRAVAKTIAEAIRNGDMSPLYLTRLVGEGHIIRNKGRAIADVEEVVDAIEKNAGKSMGYLQSDPVEYMANAPYEEKEALELLKHAEGDELMMLGAILPDWMLKKAGIKEEKITDIQLHRDELMLEVVRPLVALMKSHTPEELRHENMSRMDLRRLDAAEKAFVHEGDKALKKLKTSPTNPHGVDQLVANWALPQLIGGKMHLGTLIDQGREAMKNETILAANDEEITAAKGKFTEKYGLKREHAANDEHPYAANDELGFREREALRKASGSELGFERDA